MGKLGSSVTWVRKPKVRIRVNREKTAAKKKKEVHLLDFEKNKIFVSRFCKFVFKVYIDFFHHKGRETGCRYFNMTRNFEINFITSVD